MMDAANSILYSNDNARNRTVYIVSKFIARTLDSFPSRARVSQGRQTQKNSMHGYLTTKHTP
jgi:hypothetical protein